MSAIQLQDVELFKNSIGDGFYWDSDKEECVKA